jgi:hypothetical protein
MTCPVRTCKHQYCWVCRTKWEGSSGCKCAFSPDGDGVPIDVEGARKAMKEGKALPKTSSSIAMQPLPALRALTSTLRGERETMAQQVSNRLAHYASGRNVAAKVRHARSDHGNDIPSFAVNISNRGTFSSHKHQKSSRISGDLISMRARKILHAVSTIQ